MAQCLEVDVASQGETIPAALSNLAEAVELYLEEVDDPQRHVTATPLVTSSRYLAPREPGTVKRGTLCGKSVLCLVSSANHSAEYSALVTRRQATSRELLVQRFDGLSILPRLHPGARRVQFFQ
ncbi:MAG: type II toxin-antitoxin system HicB family antitoxin, partial [Pseudonocardiaceae bacterium]